MKRIVMCADGTWNQRDQIDDESGKRRPTNVTKIARAVPARPTVSIRSSTTTTESALPGSA